MISDTHNQKVRPEHLKRDAYLYIRQSTIHQVFHNTESTKRQYDLRRRAVALGWPDDSVNVIDCDLGQSGASATDREGFQKLVADVGMGKAGIVLGLEVSRLARNSSDWHRLLEICALAGIFFLFYTAGKAVNWPGPVNGVLVYLGWLNIILAVFNMVPAFPLDGGRVLRSILWYAKGDLRWATKISSRLGTAFGLFLMIMGVISFIGGNFIGGLWYFLIGMFIKSASQMSYRQLLVKNALMGEPISRFMAAEAVTVPPSIMVSDLVEEYFYKYHYKMFPVTDDGMLKGCVTTKQIKELSKEQWATTKVSDIAQPCSEGNTVSPKSDSITALSLMNSTGNSRLMVVEENKLLGVISLKDMLKFMALKLDLESGESITMPA